LTLKLGEVTLKEKNHLLKYLEYGKRYKIRADMGKVKQYIKGHYRFLIALLIIVPPTIWVWYKVLFE